MKTKTLQDLSADAEQAINEHARLAAQIIASTSEHSEAERERALQKIGAVARLTGSDNPATPGKPFTASQAENYAQLDPAYAQYKERCASLSLVRLTDELAVQTAKLRAELAIALVRTEIASDR